MVFSESVLSFHFYLDNIYISDNNQSDVTEAFNSTSRYLDDLLSINNNFFDSMVNHIYLSELHLDNANVSDTEP